MDEIPVSSLNDNDDGNNKLTEISKTESDIKTDNNFLIQKNKFLPVLQKQMRVENVKPCKNTHSLFKLINNRLIPIQLNADQKAVTTTTISSLVTTTTDTAINTTSLLKPRALPPTTKTELTSFVGNSSVTSILKLKPKPTTTTQESLQHVKSASQSSDVKKILLNKNTKLLPLTTINKVKVYKNHINSSNTTIAKVPRLLPILPKNPITLTSSSASKLLVASQAATVTEVPAEKSQITKTVSTNSTKTENNNKTVEPTNNSQTITGRINIYITNGVLSDPDGPIKVMSDFEVCPVKSQDKTPTEENITDESEKQEESNNKNDNKIEKPFIKYKINQFELIPRTNARSKSLSQQTIKLLKSNNNERRLSVPNNIIDNTKYQNQQNKLIEMNALFCSENLGNISDENKSIEDSMSSKTSTEAPSVTSTTNAIYNHDDNCLNTLIKDERLDEEQETKLNSDTSNCELISNEVVFPIEDDPIDFIKWNNGIGYLKNSQIHFQFNDFGIVEVMPVDSYVKLRKYNSDKNYERPLHERDIDKRHQDLHNNLINNQNNAIYFCQICLCNGLAADFLTPDYCSTVCLKQSKRNNKKEQHHLNNHHHNRKAKYSILNNCDKKQQPQEEQEQEHQKKQQHKEKKEKKIIIPAVYKQQFDWMSYLKVNFGLPAPRKLFTITNSNGNRFSVGMKLEAIDPENSSCICVCTIVKHQQFRFKLHFDGYPDDYDFWVNADSPDLFPPNFCTNTGRTLKVPPKFMNNFNWDTYIAQAGGIRAPRYCFSSLNLNKTNQFKIGMKLEADDLKNSGNVCVATIRDVIGDRILIHFDGWDNIYDYWTTFQSPFIHPIDWHKTNGNCLTLPPGNNDKFSWNSYLQSTRTVPASKSMFSPRLPHDFKVGMKLEVVDKKVPELIRPATIVGIDEYEIKISYDGWSEQYSYWISDDSNDIFPINWCAQTSHLIEFPPDYDNLNEIKNLCGIPGCRGLGNAIKTNEEYHYNFDECPYNKKNYIKTRKLMNRFDLPLHLLNQYHIGNENKKNNKRQLVVNNCNDDENNRDDLETINDKIKRIKRSKSDEENDDKSSDNIIAVDYNNDNDNSLDIKYNITTNQNAIDETTTSSTTITNSKNNNNNNNNNNLNSNNMNMNKTKKLLINPTSINNLCKRLKTTKILLNDYGPRLQQNYSLWKHNSSRVLKLKANKINPMLWTIIDVEEYISNIPNCRKLSILFKKHDIDGEALLSLNQNDMLKYMNIKLGPAIKIYNQIVQLREEVTMNYLRI